MNISDHIDNATLNRFDMNDSFKCANEASTNESTAFLFQAAENVIRKGVTPVFLLVGIPGNLLTILVIIRQRRTANFTSVTLLFVAVADLLSLLSYYLPDWLEAISGYDLTSSSRISCQIADYIMFSSFIISPWGLVAITTDRLANIMKPLKAKTVFTARCSVYTFSSISVIAMLWSGYVFADDFSDTLNVHQFPCAMFHIDYNRGFPFVWISIHTLLCSYAPVVLLCVGNCVIAWKLFVHNKQLVSSGIIADRQKQMHRLYTLVISLNSVFVLSQIPLSIYPAFSASSQAYLTPDPCTDQFSSRLAVSKLLFYIGFVFAALNPSLNFVLYFLRIETFRTEIKALFRGANAGVRNIFGQ